MDKVTYEDLYQFRFVSDVKLSPDGSMAIFTETAARRETNDYKNRLWLIDTQTGEHHLLTERKGVSMAHWLDEEHIIFSIHGTTILMMGIHGGEARKFMEMPEKISDIVPLGNDRFLIQQFNDELMENDDDCFVADELPWWFNAKGLVNKKRRSLYIVTRTENGCSLERITPPLMDVLSVAISPDKKQIAYSGEVYEHICSHCTDLWLYDIHEKRTTKAADGCGEYSNLCYMGQNRLFFTKYTYEWAGRSPRFLCFNIADSTIEEWPFYDKAVQNSVGSDAKYGGGKCIVYSSDSLFYLEANETDTFVARLDGHGNRTYLTRAEGAVTGIDAAGHTFIMTAMRGQKLAEIYRVDTVTGQEYQLTDFNGEYVRSHELQSPESFEYLSENGYSMKGFVIPPGGYVPGKKYPVILTMHGGPKVVYGTVFHHEMQCQSARGYFVIYTNPRGSDGRGEAFADLTGKLGGPDFDDFMEFVDEALKRYPDMDKDHIGICGGSYGGFMCNWMIGHTDRFAAAVSQRSISNYMTKLLCTDIGYYHNKLQIGVYPWEDFDTLWEHSPLKEAMNAKTPTLFLQSDEDYRCYMSDAFQLFSALKRNGCDTRMILFHGENHELSRSGKPENRVTRLKEMGQWFDKYLKGANHHG